MIIGIDATPLPQRPVGAGHYIIQLIRALARQAGDEQLVVFCQRSGVPLLGVSESPRLRLVTLPDKSPPMRLLWEQVIFPSLANHYRLDLLHSLHYTMPLAYPGRRVVTLHDMTFFLFPHLHTLPKRYFFRFFIRTSSRRADALIADSESTRQDAIRLAGTPPEKIFTAQLGVTPEFRQVRDQIPLQQVRQKYQLPEHFLLYVGLLEPRKNLPTLLQAYAAIADQLPGHRLVIAGRKGWMFEEVLRQVEQSNLAEKIHFTGYVEQSDLPLVYNMADVFIYPSIYEGFGLPVLEAMACGTPVITSSVSSMPEIVGDAGVLLSPDDPRALAGAMLHLVNDPAERQRLSHRGLERAAAFTWERTAAQTIAVYHHVLSSA